MRFSPLRTLRLLLGIDHQLLGCLHSSKWNWSQGIILHPWLTMQKWDLRLLGNGFRKRMQGPFISQLKGNRRSRQGISNPDIANYVVVSTKTGFISNSIFPTHNNNFVLTSASYSPKALDGLIYYWCMNGRT
jgi:hypothetical protein